MFSVSIAFLLALLVTAALTPIVRRAALAQGVVDAPSARRVHTRKIPRLGGIAIVVGFYVPLLAIFALDTGTAKIFFHSPRMVAGLMSGSFLIAGLGLYDDIVGAGAKVKLLVQALGATAAFVGGLRIDALNLPLVGNLEMGIFALPVTILWIAAIVNALNLIDGLDGLAGGVAFFACLTNFVVAYLTHNILISLITGTLAGSIIGFLIYNFNPAKIFMGDSGSMFLGYVLACASLLGAGSTKSPTLIAILVPLLALGLPIMDMLFAIARRFLERRSIFSPDRAHIHHRLIDLGLTQRRAVLVLYGLSLAFTAAALAIYMGRSLYVGGALLVLTLSLVAVVRFAGYFKSITDRHSQVAEPFAVNLRKGIPAALTRIQNARGGEDLEETLERFATENGLLAIAFVAGEGSKLASFRVEVTESSREAVCAKFNIVDAAEVTSEIQFYWDAPDGTVGPRAEILLRLVADGVESVLQRPARARAAASSGRLRPVS
jgi:UDP-GlcNAc:undecaprenyl-phosphate GlcNAc-1-phosphate transferase